MEGLQGIAETLDSHACVAFVFAGEGDILQALTFARFDAMVVDFDVAPRRALRVVKRYRAVARGESPLPVVGLASRMPRSVLKAASEGIIDQVLHKPTTEAELHRALGVAVGAARHRLLAQMEMRVGGEPPGGSHPAS